MKKGYRLLVLVLLLSACSEPERPVIPAGRFRDAAAYNDFIVSLNDTLLPYRAAISEAINNDERKQVPALVKQFRERTLRVIDTVEALQDWKGDTTLKAAAAALFRVYEASALKYPALLPILYTEDATDTAKVSDTLAFNDSLDPNEALIPKYEQVEKRITRNETEALDHFLTVQEAFAKKFNVKLPLTKLPKTEED